MDFFCTLSLLLLSSHLMLYGCEPSREPLVEHMQQVGNFLVWCEQDGWLQHSYASKTLPNKVRIRNQSEGRSSFYSVHSFDKPHVAMLARYYQNSVRFWFEPNAPAQGFAGTPLQDLIAWTQNNQDWKDSICRDLRPWSCWEENTRFSVHSAWVADQQQVLFKIEQYECEEQEEQDDEQD